MSEPRERTAVRTGPLRPAGVGHRLGGRTKEETAVRSRRTKDGVGAPWRCVERRGHDSCAAGTVCKVLGVIYTKTLPLGRRGNYSNSLATNDKATDMKYKICIICFKHRIQ